MCASWRSWAPRNQAAVRPFTERTKRSSPWRTTQIVTGLCSEPSCRSGAICSSSAASILLSSSLVHAVVAAIGTSPYVMFVNVVLRVAWLVIERWWSGHASRAWHPTAPDAGQPTTYCLLALLGPRRRGRRGRLLGVAHCRSCRCALPARAAQPLLQGRQRRIDRMQGGRVRPIAVQRPLEAGAIIEVALDDVDARRGRGAGHRRVQVARQRPDREPLHAEVAQDGSTLLAGRPSHENGTVSVVSDLR